MVDVAHHVEVRGHRPGGPADGQQDVAYVHPQPVDGRRAGGEQIENLVVAPVPFGGAEEGEGTEVHGVAGGFEVPERQVEGARSSLLTVSSCPR